MGYRSKRVIPIQYNLLQVSTSIDRRYTILYP